MKKCNKSVYLANKSIDMIDAVNKGYADGYNKAIDDFSEKLNAKCDGMIKEKWNSNVSPISWAEAYADFKDDIDEIAEQLKEGGENEKERNAFDNAKQIVQEVAEEFATDTNVGTNGWIPCSEMLPEEPFGCLVTVIDCEPSTQTDFENILPYFVGYDGERWNDEDGNEIPFEVIAWQPLPEPFKESD